MISQQVKAIALYFALAEEWDTIVCFFIFKEIGELLRNIQYPK
jgi:hypothetical protein